MSYWDAARSRATRRRSLWNLLLIPAALIPWFLGWWVTAIALGHVYRLIHPRAAFVILPDTIGGVLIAVGLLFAWCPVAMMIGNVLVHAVSPARRALDQEGRTVPGGDLHASNRGLMRLSATLVPLGLVVSCVGLFL